MADIGVCRGALFLCDLTACTGFGWDRVNPAIQHEGRGTVWERLLDLTAPLGSILTPETSRGDYEPVPF